ncbi:hypothetical protein FQR65_LT09915 [Abscondita terminalis]|nr:hypothetical protein FQR65_LT09915 [Abscondita terminalis]
MAAVHYGDNDSIYSCDICCKMVQQPSIIYYCTHGHFFCQYCFKEDYSKDKRNVCPSKYCKSLIYRMDKECLIEKNLETANERKMFPEFRNGVSAPVRSSCSIVKNHSWLVQDSFTTLSKKPINCPHPGCRRTIAVSAVNEHFRYDHKLITTISTQYEVRNELKINPTYLETNQPTCIILINILEGKKPSQFINKSSINPIFLIMASNITNKHMDLQEDLEEYSYDEDAYSCYQAIFWIASNIVTKLKYTLSLSTVCETIRVKYYGLISQINESCIKLSDEGKGLILHRMQILKMTSHGKKPLSLDFIIHKEEIG